MSNCCELKRHSIKESKEVGSCYAEYQLTQDRKRWKWSGLHGSFPGPKRNSKVADTPGIPPGLARFSQLQTTREEKEAGDT